MKIKDIIDILPHSGEYTQRKTNEITTIVIHHSASPAGKFSPKDFANWHITGKYRMPRIAYHFCIEPDGTVYQTNKITSISWHASNANYYSVGILLNGDFRVEKPTVAQMQTLRELIPEIEKMVNKKLELKGHREVDATSCPGDNMMILKNEWRSLNK